MATRDETLRLSFEVDGIANLRELRTQIDALGDEGKQSAAELSQLTDALANSQGLQQSVARLRELGQQYLSLQQRIREAQVETVRLDAASKAQAASAGAIRAAIEEQRIGLERLADAARKGQVTEEARQRISAESRVEIQRLSSELKQAEAAQRGYDAELEKSRGTISKLSAQQEKLRAPLAQVRSELQQAGVSTKSYAAAQAELQARAAGSEAALRGLAGAVSQQVAGNRAAAVSAKALADANETLGRRGFGDIRAEIQKVQAAYETLRRSGTLSVRELAQASSATIERTRQLRAEFGSLGNSLRQVQGSLIAAGASLFTVTRLLADSGRASSEFSTAIAEVSTLLSDTSGIEGLTESVRALSREFGGTATEQAKALYQIISSGATDAADANRILAQSNKLAIAGVSDLKTAADGITSVLNAYGKSASDAEGVSDSLFAAVRAGKTTVDELAGSVGQVAPIAATAGVSFEELAATIATLTQGGVATTQAVTQIRAVLNAVVKPTKEARDAAEELGIQFDLAGLRSQGLAGFLQTISERAGGNEEAIAKLFGSVEGLQAVFALVGKSAGQFEANLQSVATAAGATQTAFERIDDTPAQRLARFTGALDQLKVAFGDSLAALSPILEGLTGLLNLFNELPSGVRTTVAGLASLAAVIAPVAIAITQSRAALVLLLGSLSSIGGASTAAAAGITTVTTATNAATAASTRLNASLGLLGKAFALVSAASVGWEIGSALNEPLNRYRLSVDEAAQSTVKFAVDVDTIGQAGAEAADKFSNFSEVAVKSAAEVQALGESQRASYQVALEGLSAYLQGRAQELIAAQKSRELTEQEQQEKQRLFSEIDRLRQGFVDLQSASLGAAKSVAAVAESGSSPAIKKLADELAKAADSGKGLGDSLRGAFDGVDFNSEVGKLADVVRAIDLAAASSEKAGAAIRDGLGAELAKLSAEELLRFQQAAQLAFDGVEGGAEKSAALLDSTLNQSIKALGVNFEAAGIKITAEGREVIASFKTIAQNAQASAQAIAASFSAALGKATTSGELQALEESLKQAFNAGRIGAEEYGRAVSAAAKRSLEIKQGAQEAIGAIGGIGKAGQEAANALVGALVAARAQLGAEAEKISAAIGAALADGKPTEALRAQLAGVDEQIKGTTAQIDGLRVEIEKTGPAGERAGINAAGGFDKITDSAKRAAEAAKEAGGSIGQVGQQTEQTEKKISGASNALDALNGQFRDARASVEALGPAALEAFDRVNTFSGVLRTTGLSTAGVMQLIADNTKRATDEAEAMVALWERSQESARRNAEAFQQAAQAAADSAREISDINRQLEDERDRLNGDDEAIRRRQYQEQLRRLDELAATGDANAKAQAARSKQLAKEVFEADIANIRAREREQLDSDGRVESSRASRRSGGGATSAGAIGPNRPAEDPRQNFQITFNGPALGTEESLARTIRREIEKLQRLGAR